MNRVTTMMWSFTYSQTSWSVKSSITMLDASEALGTIIMNKASGGDGIPAELFQILTDNAVKVLHSICQQIWKTQQWPQDWKRSVFIPVTKKGSAKECSTSGQLCLFQRLVR